MIGQAHWPLATTGFFLLRLLRWRTSLVVLLVSCLLCLHRRQLGLDVVPTLPVFFWESNYCHWSRSWRLSLCFKDVFYRPRIYLRFFICWRKRGSLLAIGSHFLATTSWDPFCFPGRVNYLWKWIISTVMLLRKIRAVHIRLCHFRVLNPLKWKQINQIQD